MMVCSKSMINVATKMQQRWGIPYFEGSFYGISDMSNTLREIARLLVAQGAPAELQDRTEALIAVEETRAWERIRAYRERLAGKKVLLITGGVKSWSVVSALQEAGLEVVGTSVKKSTKEDKQKIVEIMGADADAHMIDDLSPRQMYAMLRDAKADIMLSGGRSQFVALKARMPWMDINQERHHAFAGYEGMVTMVAEIDKALFNPMWREVRTPAPWEQIDPLLAAGAAIPAFQAAA
jgi:nitrogenase molybdenum-cofactor synthesis protein NifE